MHGCRKKEFIFYMVGNKFGLQLFPRKIREYSCAGSCLERLMAWTWELAGNFRI
jgi:hypothetical protein